MRFFPLAMAEMRGEGVCVAGVDADNGQWVRPVAARYRCVFPEQASQFEWNYYHELQLGGRQPRGPDDDPLGHHAEDRLLASVIRREPIASATEKHDLLERVLDRDLAIGLSGGRRSLFLLQPRGFSYGVDNYGKPRFVFRPPLLAMADALTSSCLEVQRIAASKWGIPCTCSRWATFAQARWPKAAVSERSLRRLDSSASLYLTLSLSALHDEKYWLIVAGAHVVGKDAIWL
jgi:hypothetical protein